MTEQFLGEVEVILDLRDYRPAVTRPEEFQTLWNNIEPVLHGRELTRGIRHHLDTPHDGSVGLEVVWLDGGRVVVDAGTRFSVVAVRERAVLNYRCRTCAEAGTDSYGPFLCQPCQQAGMPDRVCDDHVVILDGSLEPACPQHRPACAFRGCTAQAAFRCAGRRCRRRTAWCQTHRRRHPGDRDVDYCPSCYEEKFPECEEPSCRGVGTVDCEYVVDETGHRCGRRSCTRHGHRWQVYGGERVGLGLCRAHRDRRGMTVDDVLLQIVVASAARRPAMRPPSLSGFGHNLRKAGHYEIAVDYPAILSRLKRLYAHLAAGRVGIRGADRHLDAWARQVAKEGGARAEGQRLLERLRALVLEHDRRHGAKIAAGLRLVQYKAPTGQRPGLLFVDVDQDLRGLFAGTGRRHLNVYSERLGLQVRLERGKRS